jgi:2-oxoglutarate ferredoxin oxidoreductase subunit gamma
MVRKCDVLIAMSQEALDKYLKDLKEDGILIADATNIKKIPETQAKVFNIPATEYAEETFGSAIYANMLMLGALTKATSIITEESMEKAIEDTTAKDFADMNKRALKKGEELI